MSDLELICNETIKAVRVAGRFIGEQKGKISRNQVEVKGLHNYVTYVDKTAEEMLVKQLSRILPEAVFLTEEATIANADGRLRWIIDPLDGTTNFIHGLYPFAVSVGLTYNDEIILGVVYEVGQDECFYAYKDSPAYCNGEIIKVTNAAKVSDSLVVTGFPYTSYDHLPRFMETLSYFMQNSHGMRRLGSAATDLAYVACGRFEAFYEYGLAPWDVAGGAFIVQQAGGRVSDFSGGNNYLYGKEIIATNSRVFDEFQKAVYKIMKTA